MIDFLCVTSPKAGTTSLQNYLTQHPEIFLPLKKELQFFNFNWDKGLDWYFNHFDEAKKGQKVGEITPTYLINRETIKRINRTLGDDIKFILMVRDPVDRLISEHLHNRRRQHTNITLEGAIEKELNGDYPKQHYKYNNIINNSRYYSQTKRLLNYFDLENLYVVILEYDFAEDSINSTLNDLCKFIGVGRYNFSKKVFNNEYFEPRFSFIQYLVHKDNFIRRFVKKTFPEFSTRKRIRELIFKLNASSKKNKPKYSDKLKKDIYEKYFAEDVSKFEKLINRDLTIWKR